MQSRRSFLQHSLAASAVLLRPSLLFSQTSASANPVSVRDAYFRRMAKWAPVIAKQLHDQPSATLKELEAIRGWYHLPYNVLTTAVLYTKQSPDNPFYRKPEMLKLALDLGDLMEREDRQGTFSPRLDSYRDVYMWLEAYALLKNELGEKRDYAWRASLERNTNLLVPEIALSRDAPAYTENFLGSSPNHLAWWSATVMIAGFYLNKPQWIALGGGVLKRFSITEQNPDGYWGEHNPNAPTGGYNYLTAMAVGLYYEHTQDPDALKALQRATTFHANFTYPDGNLMELMNDRNRYWHISPWGQFAFSHFPEGRGYCALLTEHMDDTLIDLDMLGLFAMNALYYHEGAIEAPPPQRQHYVHRLVADAGVRKAGPWVTVLSGIIDTPLPRSQWFLDRQSNLSLFHTKSGLIVNGAFSKHQTELATFSEKIDGTWISQSKGSRLAQSESGDALALAFNAFSAEMIIPPPSEQQATLRIDITGRGPAQEAFLSLQLCLLPGSSLVTASGRTIQVGKDAFELSSTDLGGHIEHNGWSLALKDEATLKWPVFPYNPYRNAPETGLQHAVALLRIPLNLKTSQEHWLQPQERSIELTFRVNS